MTWQQMLDSFMDRGATAEEAIVSVGVELARKRDEALADADSDEERDYIWELYSEDRDTLARIAETQAAASRETEACPPWAR